MHIYIQFKIIIVAMMVIFMREKKRLRDGSDLVGEKRTKMEKEIKDSS